MASVFDLLLDLENLKKVLMDIFFATVENHRVSYNHNTAIPLPDLTQMQLLALYNLYLENQQSTQDNPYIIRQFASEMGLPASVTKFVDTLERLGLIERVSVKNNLRAKTLRLTSLGDQYARLIERSLQELDEDLPQLQPLLNNIYALLHQVKKLQEK